MDQNQNQYSMTPFDCDNSSESLQILKAAIPYAPASMQRMLGMYVYANQFRLMMEHYSQDSVRMMSEASDTPSIQDILQNLCQYAGSQKGMLENLSSVFSAFQLFLMMQSDAKEEPACEE